MGISAGPNSISNGLVFHIDPANPRSYNGSGTLIYDLVTGGIAGTLSNGPTYDVSTKGGLIFDGVNDYASFGRRADLQGTNITISTWAKFASLTSGDVAILFGWTDGVNWRQGFGLGTYASGIRSYLASIEFKASLNTWYHVATSSIGGSNILYINGIGVSSSVASIVYASTNVLTSGWGGDGYGSYGKFTLGSTKIFNRALTSSEILQEYNSTKKRYSPDENYVKSNLVLNLDFGDVRCYPGIGTQAFDLSGFGHTATLVNGAAYNTAYGGNILCDGTNDYIEVVTSSALDFGTNNFTVEYWYRKTEYTSSFDNIWGPNIWRAGNDASNNEWSLGIGQGAVQTAGIGESAGFYLQIQTFGVYGTGENRLVGSLNKFNQIVGIRNGSLIELYFNGSVLYSATPGGGFDNLMQLNNVSNNIRISNSYLNSYYTKAHSGIVRIYNKALSAREVAQNYRAMLPRLSDPDLITDGLILNYDFGSADTYPGSGNTAVNLTGTGLTGTLTNSPAYSTLGGGSLTFNGTNTYISSADPGLAIPFTMNVWIYFNSLNGWQTFIGQDTSTAVARGRFYFQRANSNALSPITPGRINFTLTKSDGEVWIVNSLANPTVSTWTNYTVTVSSTQMSLYQNGILQESTTGTLSLQPGTGSFTYGVGWYDNILADYSNLNMSSVQIYNRALSQSEISQNFNNMRNRFGV